MEGTQSFCGGPQQLEGGLSNFLREFQQHSGGQNSLEVASATWSGPQQLGGVPATLWGPQQLGGGLINIERAPAA